MPAKFPCRFLTWNEVEDMSQELAHKILLSGFQPDIIVAVARGGLVGARLVSDILGVTDFTCVRIAHWGETA
ncbi:MAG: phosphoribosyltransferase, partial [Thermoprotei archaeon]